MSQYVKTSSSPKDAEFIFKGSYTINKNSIDVTYKLVNKYGKTILTRVVNFNEKAYKNYRIKPQTIDFERLLHQGVVLSNKLKIDISTNKGNRNLVFKINRILKY